jgi:hypothetical protein
LEREGSHCTLSAIPDKESLKVRDVYTSGKDRRKECGKYPIALDQLFS